MRYLISLFVTILITNAIAKDISADQVKVAYTYNFLKHTQWPDESKFSEYDLLVVSKNESLKNMFLMLSSRKLLNDKRIHITFYDGKTPPKGIEAVYVDDENAALYEKFFYAYEFDNVLLISDDFKDRRKVLINLVQNGDMVTFEINKANILNRSLRISPDLVFLGGTEIDVAKLYKSSQDELKEQKEAIATLNKKIVEKTGELTSKMEALERQKKALEDQKLKLETQNLQIITQQQTIAEQNTSTRSLQQELESIRRNIERQKEQLATEERSIVEKEFILQQIINAHLDKQQEINRANTELEMLNRQIKTQKEKLVYKEGVITNQREMIGILLIFGSIIIILALYVIRQNRRLDELSQTDPLTGLFNRRAFLPKINDEIERFNRYGSPLSILLIDIDHFKTINDTLGHDKGDKVLKTVSALILSRVRKTDLSVRWGGEEFMILATGTGIENAIALAEDLRQSVESSDFDIDRTITVSIGVASAQSSQTADELVKAADIALYEAKESGRNRVVTFGEN